MNVKQILVICSVLGTSSGYSMMSNNLNGGMIPPKKQNISYINAIPEQTDMEDLYQTIENLSNKKLVEQGDYIYAQLGRDVDEIREALKQDIESLRTNIGELSEKVDALKKNNNKQNNSNNNEQVNQLLKEVKELSYEVSVLTDSDNNEIPLLKSKISDLSTQLNQFDWKIDEVSNNSEKVTELLEKVKELSDKLKKNDKLIGDMIDDIQGLSDKIGNNNNKELSEEVKELSIKVNNSNNNEQITELLNKVNELSDKVNILSNQDNSQEDNSQEDNNNEQVNQLLKKVNELSDKVDNFASTYTQEDILNATVNSTLAHDKVKSFTEEFSEKIDKLSNQVNGLEKNKADIKDLSKNVQQDMQYLRDNLHSVQTDISSCWFNLTELSKQVTSDNSNNNEQIEQLLKKVNNLSNQVNNNNNGSNNNEQVKRLLKKVSDLSNQVNNLSNQVNNNNNGSNNYEQIEQLLKQVNNLSKQVKKVNDSNVNDKLDAWELSSLSIRMKNLENLFRNVNRNVFMERNSIFEQMNTQVKEEVAKSIGKLQKQVDDFYNILSTSFESLDNLKNELNIKDIRKQIVLFLEKDTKKYTLSSSQYCFYKERIYKDRNGIIKDLIDKKLINHTMKNTNDANNTNDTYEISNKITDIDYFKYLIEINSFALDNHQIIIKRLEDNLKNILSNSLFKNNIQFMVDKIEKQSNDLKIIIGEYKELETQVLNLLNTNKARNENLNKTFNEIASKYKITNKKVENMYNNFYQFLIIKHA